jgi:hypothetical protein
VRVAIGSVAACVALTGGLAVQHLATSGSSAASSSTPVTSVSRGDDGEFGDDGSGFAINPFSGNPFSGANQQSGGAVTTSHGS